MRGRRAARPRLDLHRSRSPSHEGEGGPSDLEEEETTDWIEEGGGGGG